ncbi:Modification methylase HhaI [bioreactor metagenome]|uniref:Modification methylase HhaI n=1 Tax=bioreactor metagenome TaxID=1076179 RepID=A0A645DEU8_9ZZZZ
MNAADYNIPQIRKRLYIVAFREDLSIKDFFFPKPIKRKRNLSDLLETDENEIQSFIIDRNYNLRDNYSDYEKKTKRSHIRIGEIGLGRQGERIYSIEGCATTLSSSSGGLGGRTGIYFVNDTIRKLSPRECGRLMGFPDDFIIAQAYNQAYSQFGNSVVVDVLQYIVMEIVKKLNGGEMDE